MWRRPQGANFKLAVDMEGRLVLARWDGSTTDKLIQSTDEEGYTTPNRADINYPELNQWGNSPNYASLDGDNDVEITFNGQHFVMAGDGSTFTPELQDYQP